MPKHGNRCPEHYEIDCYTGCPFGCLYCVEREGQQKQSSPYSSPEELLESIRKNNPQHNPVYLSPRTDAYQPLEETNRITGSILKSLSCTDNPFFVITKSPLVLRDAEFFRHREAFIAVSLNSLDDELSSRLEPGTPSPSERMELITRLCAIEGLRTVVKIDPILPGLTDNSRLEDLLARIGDVRPYAVTAETARLNRTILGRLQAGLPQMEYMAVASHFPDPGETPEHPALEYRLRLFQKIASVLKASSVPVSFCRATLPQPVNNRDCRGGFG